MTQLKCPNCGYENPLDGRFCSNCGKSLTQRCKVCDEHNLLDAKFCRKCGNELTVALAGLSLDRALLWREQFRQMGWWDSIVDDQKGKNFGATLVKRLIQEGDLPPIESNSEPWIFACSLRYNEFKPRAAKVNKDEINILSKGYIVATRCRFALLTAREMKSWMFLFTDINGFQIKPLGLWSSGRGNTILELTTQHGDKITWWFQLPGPGVMDVVLGLQGSDPVARAVAHVSVASKDAVKRDFKELLGQFFKEIIDVKE